MLPYAAENVANLNFTFTITLKDQASARNYTASIPIPNNALEAGNSYMFTVTFVNDEITFNNTVNVINWVNVSGGKPVIPVQTN